MVEQTEKTEPERVKKALDLFGLDEEIDLGLDKIDLGLDKIDIEI